MTAGVIRAAVRLMFRKGRLGTYLNSIVSGLELVAFVVLLVYYLFTRSNQYPDVEHILLMLWTPLTYFGVFNRYRVFKYIDRSPTFLGIEQQQQYQFAPLADIREKQFMMIDHITMPALEDVKGELEEEEEEDDAEFELATSDPLVEEEKKPEGILKKKVKRQKKKKREDHNLNSFLLL
jgi:hypothetical protein